MKKLSLLLIAGSALALSACGSTGMGNVETAAPYDSHDRTISYGSETYVAPAPVKTMRAERVFRDVQAK